MRNALQKVVSTKGRIIQKYSRIQIKKMRISMVDKKNIIQ